MSESVTLRNITLRAHGSLACLAPCAPSSHELYDLHLGTLHLTYNHVPCRVLDLDLTCSHVLDLDLTCSHVLDLDLTYSHVLDLH